MTPKLYPGSLLLRLAGFLLIAHGAALGQGLASIKTVFIIVMENQNWATIKGSANAPFINNTLLPMASHAERYYNPPGLHPSEPNYLWLEAGTNFGIFNDSLPSVNQQTTTNHLVTLLATAGISWKTYQESYVITDSPLTNHYPYAAKHNPFVFFTDVTRKQSYRLDHIRPYSELAGNLKSNSVARYNFLVPNLCDDMHDLCGAYTSRTKAGDDWLAREIPAIMASQAYQDNGAIFITWDEGASASDGPIGMIVLSPLAKGGGYSNTNHYTHSSTLRTLQEIFNVRPFLGDAAKSEDLGDLFRQSPMIVQTRITGGRLVLTLSGVQPGRTNTLEASSDMRSWSAITNFVGSNVVAQFSDLADLAGRQHFFRTVSQ